MFSEETENFVMEIKASPSTSFLDLHNLILRECGYKEQKNHTFLICNDNWKVQEKIHLRDTGSTDYDEDLYIMEDTTLEDFIEEEGQKIAYIFDEDGHRPFLIELVENIFGERTGHSYVSRRKGTPPAQITDEQETDPDNTANTQESSNSNEENEDASSGNDSFAEDELDMEGFEITEM